jgi:DNA-directed RNA polymerase subunit RPC12/RpoP
MSDMNIYDFDYVCPVCKKEVNVTQSNPLQEHEVLHCFGCGRTLRVKGLKEIEVEVIEVL